MLGFMAVSGFLGRWNLSHLSLSCKFPEEVYDGIPTLLTMSLENNRSRLPTFLMEVSLGDKTILFPLVPPGESVNKTIETTFEGRGIIQFKTALIRSRFPINFFVRWNNIKIDQNVTVFPRPLNLGNLNLSEQGSQRGNHKIREKGQEGDIHRISIYRGGEPLKLIHWKLSAKHDALLVKELSMPSQTPVIIDLETITALGLEKGLSYAAYLVTRLIRNGREVGIKTRSFVITPRNSQQQKLKLLRTLALYGKD